MCLTMGYRMGMEKYDLLGNNELSTFPIANKIPVLLHVA